SAPVPPAASPDVRRPKSRSSAPAVRDSTAPAPDVALPTSGRRLPASGRSASNTAPALPRPVSNIALSIPLLLPRPAARAAIRPSQVLGVAAKRAPLKLVLAIDFDIGHNHGQHLLMNIDSRYPVRHKLPPGGSGERASTYINQGRRLSPLPPEGETTPNYSLNHARSGSDSGTASTCPLLLQPRRSLAITILPAALSDFHEVSRAEGPPSTVLKLWMPTRDR